MVLKWKAGGKKGGGGGGGWGWLETVWGERRLVFRALCKTLNRPGLARSVDVRVVGPLGQVAFHI